jgi:hypothetical protein
MPIAAAKEMELSKAFLDLLRSRMASDKRRCFEKARECRGRIEVKDNLLYHGNRWVTPHDPALKLRSPSQNHDSKVAGHFGQRHRGCLRLLARIAGSLKEAEKHRGCLEPLSRIGGSLKEASGIENA